MKLPYGYVLLGDEVAIHEGNANVVRNIFEHYLAGASLGKIVDMLFAKGILSPTRNPKWTSSCPIRNISQLLGQMCIWMLNLKRIAGVMWIMTKPDIRENRPDISPPPWEWNKAVQILSFLIYL